MGGNPVCPAQPQVSSGSHLAQGCKGVTHSGAAWEVLSAEKQEKQEKTHFLGFYTQRAELFWENRIVPGVSASLVSAYTWQELHASSAFLTLF